MNALPARTFREDMPLALLDPPGLDARIERDEADMEALTRDVARRGVILPAIAFAQGNRFELVDGYSRFLASQRAGKDSIPCFVYPTKELALEGVKYALNIFRLEMTPAEEAIYFNNLFEHECQQDVDRICALVNQSRNYVENRLALIQGNEEVFEAVRQKQIKLGVAAELNKITDPEYVHYYLVHAIRGGATVGTVAGWVQEYQNAHGDLPARPVDAATPGAESSGVLVDPNRCLCCGKSDHAHAIRWVPVHTHCQLAILDPMLAAYRGEGPSTS